MTMAGLACRPAGLRRLGRAMRGAALPEASPVGVAAAGRSCPAGRPTRARARDALAPGRAAVPPAPAGRIVVAVVLGTGGSVGTDALAPYEVFARSSAFLVYTVFAGLAAACSPAAWPWCRSTRWRMWTPARCPSLTWSWYRPLSARRAKGWHRCATGRSPCRPGSSTSSASASDRRCWPPVACSTAAWATSHWSNIAILRRKHPQVEWVRGQRYVVDGSITTIGGVTAGIFGALRLVGQLARPAEAERVGRELGLPRLAPRRPRRHRCILVVRPPRDRPRP